MSLNSRIVLLWVLAAAMLATGCGYQYHCSNFNGPSCYQSSSSGGSGGSGGSGSGGGGIGSGGSGGSGGTGSGGGSYSAFLYYIGFTGLQVAGLDQTGTLNLLPNLTVPLATGGSQDVVIVNKSFIYFPFVPIAGTGGEVQAYALDHSTGAVTAITGGPFPTGTGHPDSIAVDPMGRFLYLGESQTGNISAFSIDSTSGVLTAVPGSPFQAFAGAPTSLAVDGSSHYLYAAPGLFGFTIDQNTGQIAPIAGSPFNSAAATIRGEPSGQFMIAIPNSYGFGNGGNSVEVLNIEQGTGAILATTDFPTVNVPITLAVAPNGKYIYTFALDPTHNPLPVEGFVLSGGLITPISGSPFASFPGIETGKIDQNGTELFGTNGFNGYIVYSIDSASGSLTQSGPTVSTSTEQFFAVTN